LTNPSLGTGYVPLDRVVATVKALVAKYGTQFGDVAGWEYFDSLPSGNKAPYEWALMMTKAIKEDVSTKSRLLSMQNSVYEIMGGCMPGPWASQKTTLFSIQIVSRAL
jgi:hypothetical protein